MAFPSISTGAYRFPVERAARIALRETVSILSINADLLKVVFACFDRRTYECYRNALTEEINQAFRLKRIRPGRKSVINRDNNE